MKVYKVKMEADIEAESPRDAESIAQSLLEYSPEVRGIGAVKAGKKARTAYA